MKIVNFIPQHLEQIDLQEKQLYMKQYFSEQYKNMLVNNLSFTAISEDRIIAISGLVEQAPNRAWAWILLSKDSGKFLYGLHKKILSFLRLAPYLRIETIAESDFTQANRWLELLNFSYEGQLKHFHSKNNHVKLYALYNH